ncbi:MarR family winged helix-turn-helix transcriptional regulator [Streptomyces griseus]|uniref:MarR family winged helix-turn-helix transcriptional regulator n=1 Tax=Streptomyces griseus TaxID=1911 RepID=UPI00362782EF
MNSQLTNGPNNTKASLFGKPGEPEEAAKRLSDLVSPQPGGQHRLLPSAESGDAATPRAAGEQRENWQSLVILAHLVEAELERKTQCDAGIAHSHFKILALLAGADRHTMGLTRLGRALRFHKSRLSHALRSLEAAGLLRREGTPDKGRAYQAVLTRRGLDLVERVLPLQDVFARDVVLSGLTATEIAQLRTLAEKIIANLDAGRSGQVLRRGPASS